MKILIYLLVLCPMLVVCQRNGTGFLISDQGHIVTCDHVVGDAKTIHVIRFTFDGRRIKHQASVLARSSTVDLVILQVKNFPQISLPYSIRWTECEVGEKVFTLGYPLQATMGVEIKLTDGIVSSTSGYLNDKSLYQITVPVQPGNSGGPLFDENGFVVGITNAVHTGAENAAYAIKTSALQKLLLSERVPVPTSSLNLLRGKSLMEQVKLAKNSVFIVEATSDESREPKEVEGEVLILTLVQRAPVRKEPNPDSDILGFISPQTPIITIGTIQQYWKIYPFGYIHESYFRQKHSDDDRESDGNLTADGVQEYASAKLTRQAYLRSRPGGGGVVLAVIPKGEEIYVMGFERGSWEVYHAGKVGYLLDGLYFIATLEMLRLRR